MRHPNPNRALYLGMRPGDLDGKPYAKYWRPAIAPLSENAREALLVGPVAAPLLPPVAEAPSLLLAGDTELEDGFGMGDDGSLHVAIRTVMPRVTAPMIDWWFGWHSREPQRYKLWHPRAHVHAEWGGHGRSKVNLLTDREKYVGRVSFVDEYVGSPMSHVAIHFQSPSKLGLDESKLSVASESTAVCARICFANSPIEAGTLLHHVRKIPGGTEMRSRFWLGGRYGAIRGGGMVGQVAARVVARWLKPTNDVGRDLLVHCAQEMGHLAAFLPDLYAELRDLP